MSLELLKYHILTVCKEKKWTAQIYSGDQYCPDNWNILDEQKKVFFC